MKLEICAVFDKATECFGRPIFVRSLGEAMRSFLDEAKNDQSELGKHPEDYSLFHLGEFDDVSGRFIQFERPVQLLAGKGTGKAKVA